ncbi:MAG: hypothetical protein ACREV4_02415 [Gammaproteobacteria bacterium]
MNTFELVERAEWFLRGCFEAFAGVAERAASLVSQTASLGYRDLRESGNVEQDADLVYG